MQKRERYRALVWMQYGLTVCVCQGKFEERDGEYRAQVSVDGTQIVRAYSRERERKQLSLNQPKVRLREREGERVLAKDDQNGLNKDIRMRQAESAQRSEIITVGTAGLQFDLFGFYQTRNFVVICMYQID